MITNSQLLDLMGHPDRLDEQSLSLITQITKDYPYFQGGWMLYLCNLTNLHALNLHEEVHNQAFRFTDRYALFAHLHKGTVGWVKFLNQEETSFDSQPEDNSTRSFELIDTFLKQQDQEPYPDNIEDLLPSDIVKEGDYTHILNEKPDLQSIPESGEQQDSQAQLIDNFIALDAQQKVCIVDEDESSNVSKTSNSSESLIQEDAFLTESLAKIYIKQKKYSKALEIIKKLSLKYPEKNVYFADQIRFLEKIITNIKSE